MKMPTKAQAEVLCCGDVRAGSTAARRMARELPPEWWRVSWGGHTIEITPAGLAALERYRQRQPPTDPTGSET